MNPVIEKMLLRARSDAPNPVTQPNCQLIRRLKADSQQLLDLLSKYDVITKEHRADIEQEMGKRQFAASYISFTDAFEGKARQLINSLHVDDELLEKLAEAGVINADEKSHIAGRIESPKDESVTEVINTEDVSSEERSLNGQSAMNDNNNQPTNKQEENQKRCQRLLEILEQADEDSTDRGNKFKIFIDVLLAKGRSHVVKQLLSCEHKLTDLLVKENNVPIVGVHHWPFKRGKTVHSRDGGVVVWTRLKENEPPTVTRAADEGDVFICEDTIEGGPPIESLSIDDDKDVSPDTASAVPATARLVEEDTDIKVDVAPTTREFYVQRVATDQVYPLNKNPRGIVIIINVFRTAPTPDGKKFQDRDGTEKDAQKLTELFTALNFKVIVYNDNNDLTARGIRNKIAAIASGEIGADAQCVILFTLSHGALMFKEDLEVIFGTDGRFVAKQEIVAMLSDQCAPHLRGVPRIIFFQACRGVLWPYRDEAADNDMDEGEIMVCYPTQKYYISLRNRLHGSRYVQCLVDVFKNHARDKHIVSLMKLVNEKLKWNYNDSAYLQVSTFETSLNKKLYFFPGIEQ